MPDDVTRKYVEAVMQTQVYLRDGLQNLIVRQQRNAGKGDCLFMALIQLMLQFKNLRTGAKQKNPYIFFI